MGSYLFPFIFSLHLLLLSGRQSLSFPLGCASFYGSPVTEKLTLAEPTKATPFVLTAENIVPRGGGVLELARIITCRREVIYACIWDVHRLLCEG